jgi:DNA helicase-2/ATP-dependent DNA helicase PcrA
MPSDLGAGTTAELEEERRLPYVAMTRATENLHLIVPQRFFVHGQHSRGDSPCLRIAYALHSGSSFIAF